MKKEKKIMNYPEPVNIAGTKTILEQMIKCICKIKIKRVTGTGFFCKIPFGKNETLNVLMTNYHILDEKYYKDNKEISLLVNDENEAFEINLKKRKTYFNEVYDIAIIELKEEDGIKNYLELDDNLFKGKDKAFYEDKSIYALQYQNGKNACVSYGLLINIEKNDIKHTCSMENGSSGSPILNLENNKVIGIHKEAGLSKFNFNKGTLLAFPINDFKEEQRNDRNNSNNENEKLKLPIIPNKSQKETKNKNIENQNNSLNKLSNNKPKQLDKKTDINFLKKENIPKESIKSDKNEYIFEYLDCKEKLFLLPLFFKSLLEQTSLDNLENYTSLLFNTYSKNNSQVQILLGLSESTGKIPIEFLSKYFVKFYSADSEFDKDIDKGLRLGKIEKHLPYIKTLYEGLKLKVLPLSTNNILYRGLIISFDEFNKIKNYLNNIIEGVPGAIVFAKQFLTFSKDKKIEETYLKSQKVNTNFIKGFFRLEMENDIKYCQNTHCDIESISFYPYLKEVLFFPFSAFEIKALREISIDNDRCYQIELLYLGNYLEEKKDEKIIPTIPDSVSKNLILELGLSEKDSAGKTNVHLKKFFEKYEKYKEGLKSKK